MKDRTTQANSHLDPTPATPTTAPRLSRRYYLTAPRTIAPAHGTSQYTGYAGGAPRMDYFALAVADARATWGEE